jgi:hypothetical protein
MNVTPGLSQKRVINSCIECRCDLPLSRHTTPFRSCKRPLPVEIGMYTNVHYLTHGYERKLLIYIDNPPKNSLARRLLYRRRAQPMAGQITQWGEHTQ